MKKMPTLFKRIFHDDNTKEALNEVTPGCEWVLNGEGYATEKYDGTCCLIKDGKIYRRYDYKPGKTLPKNAIPCQEKADPITGHFPHWLLCEENNKRDDKWYLNAFKTKNNWENGTYELVGPHFASNPYKLESDALWKHGSTIIKDAPRTYAGLKEYLKIHYIEGIVFYRGNGEMCKIKRSDFGFPWKFTDNNIFITTGENSDGLAVTSNAISIFINPIDKLRTDDIVDSEKVLEEFVSRDRMIRNYSAESDYDKFCETTNIAIEKYIKYTHNLEEIIMKEVKKFENY